MIATLVFVRVKAEYINEFILATKNNHENSVLESGNIRFDILQEDGDKCKFTFYEVYISDEAVKTHKNTAHYLKWKDTVEEYMAEPRRGVKHSIVYPTDPSAW